MFKLIKMLMVSTEGKNFEYSFESGINYFKGVNNSGKTEFYKFIDYMFGSSTKIDKVAWYRNSLESAMIEFEYNDICYNFKRTLDKEVNYFSYKDEEWGEAINLSEYRDKMNSIFSIDFECLKKIREFTDEDLTYRSFTVFNYLGEKSLGTLNDFFTKAKDIKFSTKLPSILNFIFNKNLEEISKLKKELHTIQSEVNKLERSINRFDFVKNNININLKRLNINTNYIGKNKQSIVDEINSVKALEDTKKKNSKNKTITELEAILNNLNEQIKVYENTIDDSRSFEKENINRKKLLETFADLIVENKDFEYMIEPLKTMTLDLDNNISFNNYLINNNTLKALKKQRDEIKKEILDNEAKFTMFNIDDKSRYIALVEEYMNIDIRYDTNELEVKKKKIRDLKLDIKTLQNQNDEKKIDTLSNLITSIYESGKELSDIVDKDTSIDGFHIQYFKKGNLLQPQILNNETEKQENYYTGSMARHTLIQLSGYLGFLSTLVNENKYPLIPILVIDHISKPFDSDNRRAIGSLFNKFYSSIEKKKFQIFVFDDEDYSDLAINPDHYEELVNKDKSGFNPFYRIEEIKK